MLRVFCMCLLSRFISSFIDVVVWLVVLLVFLW